MRKSAFTSKQAGRSQHFSSHVDSDKPKSARGNASFAVMAIKQRSPISVEFHIFLKGASSRLTTGILIKNQDNRRVLNL